MTPGQHSTLIMTAYEDLQKLIDTDFADMKLAAFIARFENVLVGVKDIAKFHNVNERTVLNYIKDGLILPEVKVGENDHPKFRMSYAITLDFKELQKALRAKHQDRR